MDMVNLLVTLGVERLSFGTFGDGMVRFLPKSIPGQSAQIVQTGVAEHKPALMSMLSNKVGRHQVVLLGQLPLGPGQDDFRFFQLVPALTNEEAP
jgi:hypothetical protein